MDPHPLAALFPLSDGPELAELVGDIRTHGVREPVVIYQGQILDGRNRWIAAKQAGVPCPTRPYHGNDPLGFVLSANLHRRHLNESQRAMVAAKLATLRRGDNQHSEGLPIGRSSELLHVGERSVARARDVRESGTPELVHAVETGSVSVSVASDLVSLPAEEQREIVARGEREILRKAQEIRAGKAQAHRAARDARLIVLSKHTAPLPSDRKYPVVYADPPYRYDIGQRWPSRAVERHYPTMDIEDICALPVVDLCTPDGMLFLWVPAPLLLNGIRVMEAWGFEYLTSAVWTKNRFGLGIFFRQQHELLLLGKRGTAIRPAPGDLSSSVITADRRAHSQKPEEAYLLIERMYPGLPKVELFARARRAGWEAWGNEVRAEAARADDLAIPDFLKRAP